MSETAFIADELAASVIMPIFNEAGHLDQSIAAMRAQRFDGGLEFLLVDGGSTDGTDAILRRLAAEDPRIRVLANPRRTVTSGLNVGLRHARGRWVARMDAHTIYPPEYVATGVARLAAGKSRWVSGPALPVGRGPVSRATVLALASPLGRGGSRKWGASDTEFELDSGVFAGVWERTTLLEYGGWDERWSVNEDAEMAGRFLGRGERLICVPAMAAHYAPRETLRGISRQYYGWGANRIRTARHHPETLRRSALLPLALVCDFAVSLSPWKLRGLRGLCRGALFSYGLILVAATGSACQRADDDRDAWRVPLVLASMHLGNGAGLVCGVLHEGPPLAALTRVLGAHRMSERMRRAPEPVWAPSLLDRDAATSRSDR